jgi:hypothetical protein
VFECVAKKKYVLVSFSFVYEAKKKKAVPFLSTQKHMGHPRFIEASRQWKVIGRNVSRVMNSGDLNLGATKKLAFKKGRYASQLECRNKDVLIAQRTINYIFVFTLSIVQYWFFWLAIILISSRTCGARRDIKINTSPNKI